MMVARGLIPALVRLAETLDGEDRACVERTIALLQAQQPTQDGVIWQLTRENGGVVRVPNLVDAIYRTTGSRQRRTALSTHVYHRLEVLGYERIAPGTFRRL